MPPVKRKVPVKGGIKMGRTSLAPALVKRMHSSKTVGLEIDWKGFLNDALAAGPFKLLILSAAGAVIFLLLPGGKENVGRFLSWTSFWSSLLVAWWLVIGARRGFSADFEEEGALVSLVGSHSIHLVGTVLSYIWFPGNLPRGDGLVSLAICYGSLYLGGALRLAGYGRTNTLARLLKAVTWATFAESSYRTIQGPKDEPQVYMSMVVLVMSALYRLTLYFDKPPAGKAPLARAPSPVAPESVPAEAAFAHADDDAPPAPEEQDE
eukprot:tig00001388_g8573.t1